MLGWNNVYIDCYSLLECEARRRFCVPDSSMNAIGCPEWVILALLSSSCDQYQSWTVTQLIWQFLRGPLCDEPLCVEWGAEHTLTATAAPFQSPLYTLPKPP